MPINFSPFLQENERTERPPTGEQNRAEPGKATSRQDLAASIVAVQNDSPDHLEKAVSGPDTASWMTRDLDILHKLTSRRRLQPDGDAYQDIGTSRNVDSKKLVQAQHGKEIEKTHPQLFIQKMEEVRSFKEQVHSAGLDQVAKKILDKQDRLRGSLSEYECDKDTQRLLRLYLDQEKNRQAMTEMARHFSGKDGEEGSHPLTPSCPAQRAQIEYELQRFQNCKQEWGSFSTVNLNFIDDSSWEVGKKLLQKSGSDVHRLLRQAYYESNFFAAFKIMEGVRLIKKEMQLLDKGEEIRLLNARVREEGPQFKTRLKDGLKAFSESSEGYDSKMPFGVSSLWKEAHPAWITLLASSGLFNLDRRVKYYAPLVAAVGYGKNASGVQALLDEGADPNILSQNNRAPLHLILEAKNIEDNAFKDIVPALTEKLDVLLNHTATNPNLLSQEKEPQSFLHLAIEKGFFSEAERILKHPDVDGNILPPGPRRLSPLALAVKRWMIPSYSAHQKNLQNIIKALLQKDARLLLSDTKGKVIDCGTNFERFIQVLNSIEAEYKSPSPGASDYFFGSASGAPNFQLLDTPHCREILAEFFKEITPPPKRIEKKSPGLRPDFLKDSPETATEQLGQAQQGCANTKKFNPNQQKIWSLLTKAYEQDSRAAAVIILHWLRAKKREKADFIKEPRNEKESLLHNPALWLQDGAQWRKLLIESDVFNIDKRKTNPDLFGTRAHTGTPLTLACLLAPDEYAVQDLLLAGADPNQARARYEEATPLFCLLDERMNLFPQNDQRAQLSTSVAIRKRKAKWEKLDLLLNHEKIEINKPNAEGEQLLNLLVMDENNDSETAIKMLSSHFSFKPNRLSTEINTTDDTHSDYAKRLALQNDKLSALAEAAVLFLMSDAPPKNLPAKILALLQAGDQLVRSSENNTEEINYGLDVDRFIEKSGITPADESHTTALKQLIQEEVERGKQPAPAPFSLESRKTAFRKLVEENQPERRFKHKEKTSHRGVHADAGAMLQ